MKTTNSLLYAGLSFAAGLACLTGCTTVNTVERAQPVAERQMVADKRILTNPGLDRHVSIVGLNEATISTGFAKVQIELLNRTSSPYSFRYHFEWFDDKGMLIQTTAPWIDRSIQGKETMDIISVAPTETAKDFRVKFLSQ